jgi:hypothetical protein
MSVGDDAALTGADRANILDLYGRYALSIDFGDGSEWAGCFTVRGRFVANRGEGMDPVEIVGRHELDSFARNHRTSASGNTRHHFTNIATAMADGVVTGRAAILYVEGKTVLGNGLYEDELRRDGDEWLFEQRVVHHERLRP